MSFTRSASDKIKPLVVFVNPSTAVSTQVLVAEAGVQYRIHAMACVTTLANTVNLRSNTTAISANFPLADNGGFILPFNEAGWFVTAVGEGLFLNQTVATVCGCNITYTKE